MGKPLGSKPQGLLVGKIGVPNPALLLLPMTTFNGPQSLFLVALTHYTPVFIVLPRFTVMKLQRPKIHNNVELCPRAYGIITGLPERTYRAYSRNVKYGLVMKTLGRPRGTETSKVAQARAWLENYVSYHDVMPHLQHKGKPLVSWWELPQSP